MNSKQSGYCIVGTVAGLPAKVVVPPDGLKIGRSRQCDLTVLDEEVSRFHCCVRVRDGRAVVEDLSQNGTDVNGATISGEAVLRPGDVLKVGNSEFTLREYDDRMPPAAAAEEPTVLQPGDMLDRYRIRRLIGRGGMGTVYEAVHTGLDLPRALKVLTLPDDDSYAAFRDKFLDEGKILARLRHDNITQVHDAAYDEKTRTLFFVMDLVLYDDDRPCTLADVAYDECDVSAWFAALASALDYIHAEGIVHSDIKLQNVLVSSGQKIKLADFGVARLCAGKMRAALRGDKTVKSDSTIGYTAHYVAPEVLRGSAMPSAASDVYSLGVLLVRLLSGKWYDERPSVLSEIAAKREMNWKPVLAQMLDADPKRRVTNLSKLVVQLRKGSKDPVSRKFQIESRRRQDRKIRLTRVQRGHTASIRTFEPIPESGRAKALRWSALGVIVLALLGLFGRMHSRKVAAQARERERQEALSDARDRASWKLKVTRDKLGERTDRANREAASHLAEYAFAEGLSLANVTGTTDRVTAARRNGALVRYGDVLKRISDVRGALADMRVECDAFDGRIPALASTNAADEAVRAFGLKIRELADAFEARCGAERQSWSAYAAAKAEMESGDTRLGEVCADRRRIIRSVREAIAADPELAAAPELVRAAGMVRAGDRLIAAGTDDPDAPAKCYAEALASLSNGCARLSGQRTEREAIDRAFAQCEEGVRGTQLHDLRRGAASLADVAESVGDASGRFAGQWCGDGTYEVNRTFAAECAFRLQAYAAYLGHLAKTLSGHNAGLAFALADSGVTVANQKFRYLLPWADILSAREPAARTKIELKGRQLILEAMDLPAEDGLGPQLLFGRWLVLKVIRPDLNTDAQAERLVACVRRGSDPEALVCARRELPEKFADEAAPAGDVERAPEAEGPWEPLARTWPVPQNDASQERVVLFAATQGLSVSEFPDGVEIVRCLRVRGTRLVRFQLGNGYVRSSAAGARQDFADVSEGMSFEARNDTAGGRFRYELLSWIDDGRGDGAPLVLARCQYLPD